jgi:hypothetical protein
MNWSRVNMPDGTYEIVKPYRTMKLATRAARLGGLKYSNVPGHGWVTLRRCTLQAAVGNTGKESSCSATSG